MTKVRPYSPASVQADVTVGRILPKFVTPDDVRDLKVRVDAYVRATDTAVEACPKLPDGVRDGWKQFSKAWRTFFDEEDSWWHTAAQMDQGGGVRGRCRALARHDRSIPLQRGTSRHAVGRRR
jgi:hypothetical protein